MSSRSSRLPSPKGTRSDGEDETAHLTATPGRTHNVPGAKIPPWLAGAVVSVPVGVLTASFVTWTAMAKHTGGRHVTLGLDLFLWHPVSMSLALLIFMPWAVLCFVRPKMCGSRSMRNTIHGVLATISILLMVVGMSAIVAMKNIKGKPHLVSFHSKVGFALFVVGVANMLAGAVTRWGLDVVSLRAWRLVRLVHGKTGWALLVCSGLALCTGLRTHWASRHMEDVQRYAAIVGVVVTMLGVWIAAVLAETVELDTPQKVAVHS